MKNNGSLKIAFVTLVAGAALSALSSCRPPDRNDNEAMDIGSLTSGMKLERGNFLKGGCGPSQAMGTDAESEKERALRALPSNVKDYLEKAGVQWTLAANATKTKECQKSIRSAVEQTKMTSALPVIERSDGACVVQRTIDNNRSGFQIIIEKSPKAVHNLLLVESFALFYFLFDATTPKNVSSDRSLAATYASIKADRSELTSRFIKEMQKTPESAKALGAFQTMYAQGSFSATKLVENPYFQQLVLVELSDAYFCSSKTWADADMPETKAAFQSFANKYLGARTF
jgi:hypothetical protein